MAKTPLIDHRADFYRFLFRPLIRLKLLWRWVLGGLSVSGASLSAWRVAEGLPEWIRDPAFPTIFLAAHAAVVLVLVVLAVCKPPLEVTEMVASRWARRQQDRQEFFGDVPDVGPPAAPESVKRGAEVVETFHRFWSALWISWLLLYLTLVTQGIIESPRVREYHGAQAAVAARYDQVLGDSTQFAELRRALAPTDRRTPQEALRLIVSSSAIPADTSRIDTSLDSLLTNVRAIERRLGREHSLWGVGLNVLNNLQTALFLILVYVLARPDRHRSATTKLWFIGGASLAVFFVLNLVAVLAFNVEPGIPAIFSGGAAGLGLALLVGRLDSKFIDPPVFPILLLYLYAIVQAGWVWFDNHSIWMVTISGAALFLKVVLFLFIFWLYRSGILLFYVVEIDRLEALLSGTHFDVYDSRHRRRVRWRMSWFIHDLSEETGTEEDRKLLTELVSVLRHYRFIVHPNLAARRPKEMHAAAQDLRSQLSELHQRTEPCSPEVRRIVDELQKHCRGLVTQVEMAGVHLKEDDPDSTALQALETFQDDIARKLRLLKGLYALELGEELEEIVSPTLTDN